MLINCMLCVYAIIKISGYNQFFFQYGNAFLENVTVPLVTKDKKQMIFF